MSTPSSCYFPAHTRRSIHGKLLHLRPPSVSTRVALQNLIDVMGHNPWPASCGADGRTHGDDPTKVTTGRAARGRGSHHDPDGRSSQRGSSHQRYDQAFSTIARHLVQVKRPPSSSGFPSKGVLPISETLPASYGGLVTRLAWASGT